MKIKSVRIIGMHKVIDTCYNMLDMNYLYGPNGVGKSTVLQAIQLAVLGYIPGTDKNKSAIFKHCGNGNRMSVTVTFDNDTSICREYIRTSKGITEKQIPDDFNATSILGDLELPIMDFNQFIGLTANKLKDWFVNFLPDQDVELDWNAILTENAQQYVSPMLLDESLIPVTVSAANEFQGSAIERIRQTNAYLKDTLSAAKQELSRVEHTVQTLIYYSECDMSESPQQVQEMIDAETSNLQDLITLKAHSESNTKYSALYESSMRDAGTESTRQVIQSEISALTDEQVKVAAECKYHSDIITDIDQQIFEKSRIASSNGVCPYTNSYCVAIGEISKEYQDEIDALKHRRDAVMAEYERAKLKLSDIESEKRTKSADLERMQNSFAQAEKIKDMFYQDALPGDSALYDAEIAESKRTIDDLRIRLSQIESNIKYEQLTDGLTKDKYRIEQTIEVLKAWIKLTDVNGMQSMLMKAPFEHLSDSITEKLSTLFDADDISAAFNIEEKANSFSFGIVRDGDYVEYDMISSGEKCLFTLALIMSLVELSDAKLKLLLVDDILDHLDSEKIQNVFQTLYDSNGVQIILAGVQQCKHPASESIVINLL